MIDVWQSPIEKQINEINRNIILCLKPLVVNFILDFAYLQCRYEEDDNHSALYWLPPYKL